jgi:hypothetical protein
MSTPKILTGARAKIYINGKLVGLFNNCTWQIRQGKEPAFILGRFNPAEITPTTQEAVALTLSGYRVVNSGPYAVANATLLQNLLTENDFSVEVTDRATKDDTTGNELVIFKALGCRVQGWSSGVAARGVSDIRLDIIGLLGEDESDEQNDITAANLDDGSSST